jgi:GDP-L-fucose synthase
LAALIRKFHDAKRRNGEDEPVTLWGTGTPRREFLYSEDLADAVLFTLKAPEKDLHASARRGMLNVGVGEDLTITELARLIREIAGSNSEIVYDTSKPDGTPRKLLDVTRMTELGWTAKTPLRDGIRKAYDWYVAQYG